MHTLRSGNDVPRRPASRTVRPDHTVRMHSMCMLCLVFVSDRLNMHEHSDFSGGGGGVVGDDGA